MKAIDDEYARKREEIANQYTLGSNAYREAVAELDARFKPMRETYERILTEIDSSLKKTLDGVSQKISR